MAIFVYPRWPSATILDFIEPQIAPFDPTTPKTWAKTKDGVDWMHRLGSFKVIENGSIR